MWRVLASLVSEMSLVGGRSGGGVMFERSQTGGREQLMRPLDVVHVAMNDQQELVGLERGFVAQH